MNILLHISRKVVLNDDSHVMYMDSAGTDIRREEKWRFSTRENLNIALPRVLGPEKNERQSVRNVQGNVTEENEKGEEKEKL